MAIMINGCYVAAFAHRYSHTHTRTPAAHTQILTHTVHSNNCCSRLLRCYCYCCFSAVAKRIKIDVRLCLLASASVCVQVCVCVRWEITWTSDREGNWYVLPSMLQSILSGFRAAKTTETVVQIAPNRPFDLWPLSLFIWYAFCISYSKRHGKN